MKRGLGLIILIILLCASGLSATGCSSKLQEFNNYGISFTVDKELELEEYTVDLRKQVFHKGNASYEIGAVMSSDKNFMLQWMTTIPEFTQEEIRQAIITMPNVFSSSEYTFHTTISENIGYDKIAGFNVTFTEMQFTYAGGEASGITAIWYCPGCQRTMQLTLIHKNPENEVNRFINNFSCVP